ncbi:MAG: potassium channel family protein [Cyanobacteria bacterium P01_A01_bin.116]
MLYPRTGKSVISLQLSKGMWRVFRWISHLPGVRRETVLSYCGPTLLVAIASFWVCAVAFGFALFMWPALGTGIQASSGKTPTDFATAFYYSGFTLTTLGVGDLVPETGFWRFITVLEAAIGFSIITAALTYLLSVYNALTRRNTFALSLYHRSGGEVNTAALVASLKGYNDFELATQDISGIARDLLFLLESHHAYPVLHYFRFPQPYYALARIALVSLDLSALIKSALHPQIHKPFISSAAVTELDSGGLYMLVQLSNCFLSKKQLDAITHKQEWRRRYFAAIKILRRHDIETVEDIEAGADSYISLRSNWHPIVVAMAEYMDYGWREISPDEQSLS